MLRSPRDAAGEVHLGADRLPGLADLIVVRNPPRVHGGTGRSDCRSKRSRQIVQDREIFRRLHPPATGDDNVGLDQRDRFPVDALDLTDRGPDRLSIELRRPPANLTVPIAFRVYIGRVASSVPSRQPRVVQSVTIPAPSRAATRGARSRPCAVDPTKTIAGASARTASASAAA